MDYSGWWNDGLSARREAVRARLSGDRLDVYPQAGDLRLVSLPVDGLYLAEETYRGQPLRLRHRQHPDAMLTVDDHGLVDALSPVAPAIRRRFHGKRGTFHRLMVWGGALIGIVTGGFAAVHLAAGPIAAALPTQWKQSVGREVLNSAAANHGYCRGGQGIQALNDLAAHLAPERAPTLEISVIDSDTVNAFAAPGGQIGIFRGLIDEARSPAELAGVLAHEMGHVIKRHPSEAMVRSAGYSILVAALVGDTSSAMQIAARTGETLLNLAHSRSAEAEADRTAELMLNRAGYDSSGLDTFLTRMGRERGETPQALAFLASHPLTRARVRSLRKLERRGDSPLTAQQWGAVKTVCEDGDST